MTPARAPAVVMLLIAIFWDGFLLVWFGSVMSAKHPPLMLLLFPLIHVAIGVFITYQAVCGLVNRIHVRLDGEAFEFKRGPVPQRGDVREPTANIAAFEVLEQRAATTPSARRSNRPTFGIRALTKDSRAIPVRFGFTDATHAEYAAQRFSQMLAEVKQRSTYRG